MSTLQKISVGLVLFVALECLAYQAQGAESVKPKITNVLLIISDDLKASVLGCYGDRICKTPHLDKLATEGVVFTRAYCQAVWCSPSRASFMTSRYRGNGRVEFAEYFRSKGFQSTRIGKIYHMRVPNDIIAGTNGNDHEASWSERFNCQGQEGLTPGNYSLLNRNIFTRRMEGRASSGDKDRIFVAVASDNKRGDDQPDYKAANKAISILRQNRDKPFFLAVGFVRPHEPYVAPQAYFDSYPINKLKLPKTIPDDLKDMPRKAWAKIRSDNSGIAKYPDNIKRMWAGYYATVTFMDEQVGRVLDELDRLKLRDSTLVIFTSDHGYHLGEHGFWVKQNLHEEITRVPLIVSVPGAKPQRLNSLVELVDMFPTACEYLGLEIPKGLDGKSMVPLINGKKKELREMAYSYHNKYRALRSHEWAYMNYGSDGAEELYDMKKDPGQFTNLATEEACAEVIQEFRKNLRR